jgi:hypothetical protein
MAAIVDKYIGDNDAFLGEFAAAFTQMMVADRFDGPVNNACENVQTPTLEVDDDKVESAAAGYFMHAAAMVVAVVSFLAP